MSYQTFIKSQFFKNKSPNLIKLGFDPSQDTETQYNQIRAKLFDFYIIRGETMHIIMQRFDIPSSKTMHNLFKLFDIETRTWAEASLLALETGRSTTSQEFHWNSKQNWHTTWNNELVYLRSSYEEEYALELDSKRIAYKTEAMRIKYFNSQLDSYRIAIPDFYLPDTKEIVEIKSMYWYNAQEMKDKFKAYIALGFKPKLVLEKKELTIL